MFSLISKFGKLNGYLSSKEIFIRFTVHVLCKLMSFYAYPSFPFGSDGEMSHQPYKILIIDYLFTFIEYDCKV